MSQDKKPSVEEIQKFLQLMAAQKQGAQKQPQQPEPPKSYKEKFILGAKKTISAIVKGMQQSVHYLDRFINFVVKTRDPDRNVIIAYARPPIIFGVYIILIFVVGGGIWAAFAPLDSAAHAVGTVIVDSHKQIIQHQRGGIIKKIFVKQGDSVNKGDKLIELDNTEAKANYEINLSKYRYFLALEDRLIAERDDLDKIEFNDFLMENQSNPEVTKLIEVQTRLFKSRTKLYSNQINTTKKEIEQDKQKIESIKAQITSTAKNFKITTERVKNTEDLLKRGFAQKNQLQELQVRQAELEARLSGLENEQISTEQSITKHEIKLLQIQASKFDEVLKELKETQPRLSEAKESFIAAKDNLDKTIIRSPVEGIVNELNYHTIGGVINPSQPIAVISPINDKLIVEAKIPPKNISSVHVGQKAKMKFSAFKSRTSPVFHGVVTSLSPDTVMDQQTAQMIAMHNKIAAGDGSFYVAKIELDMDEFNRLAKPRDLKLIPGMNAEIFIVTGERTLLRYLLDPVADQASKAFVEK